jgi:lipopolysaccharide transport system permease protein
MYRRYLELVLYKTYADLRAERERTYLGFLWWVFEPLMFMTVFVIVFDRIMHRGGEGFVPFLLVGLVTWQWLRGCVAHGGGSIIGNVQLMRQVYLPKVLFPIIVILTDTVKFGVILFLLCVLLWLFGYRFGITVIALPIVILTELLLICGVTFLVAAVVPLVPDLRFVVDNLLLAVFFLSGIFFRGDRLPEGLRQYFYLNPMANLIQDYRNILLHNQWPDWQALLVVGFFSVALIAIALVLLARLDYLYPKIAS